MPDEAFRAELELQERLLELESAKVLFEQDKADLRTKLEEQRPCRVKWTRVTWNVDTQLYECSYGPEDGEKWRGEIIFACGHTPAEAERNFDSKWLTGTYMLDGQKVR